MNIQRQDPANFFSIIFACKRHKKLLFGVPSGQTAAAVCYLTPTNPTQTAAAVCAQLPSKTKRRPRSGLRTARHMFLVPVIGYLIFNIVSVIGYPIFNIVSAIDNSHSHWLSTIHSHIVYRLSAVVFQSAIPPLLIWPDF